MLQAIHDKAKGWIAYAIVGFISVPFALWGINSYFDGGKSLAAAVVNGEEIPARDVQSQLLQMRQQFGQMAASMGDDALKQLALDNAVNQALLRQKIAAEGYRASTTEVQNAITGIEAFQKDGRFDKEQYQNFLRLQRRNEAEFEQQVRQDLTQGQFREGVTATAFVTKADAERYQALRNQKRDIELFTLKAADFEATVQISDEQIAAYYEQNKNTFMTEEKVKLAYLDISQEQLSAAAPATEEALLAYYDEHAERYATPATRNASHILVSVEDPAKDAEAKARIDALSADIKAGTKTFEEAASKESDDKIAAENAGLLGDIVVGDWDPDFEKAVFAQAVNTISDPVKTAAGYEIIRVNSVADAVQKPFTEVKTQVDEDYRRKMAEDLFLDKAEKVQTIAYEKSGDLAPAAEAVGLKVAETDWVTRTKGEGIAADPKVLAAAFSDEVLKDGKNSELIQLSETQAVVVRVISQEAAAQKPLADVKAAIVQTLTQQESRKLAAAKGDELLKQVQASGWAALTAAGLAADSVEKPGLIGRTGNALAPAILGEAFAIPRPAEATKPSWGSVVLPNGDYALLALKTVEDGAATLEENAGQQYSSTVGGRELSALLKSLHDRAEIELHPENI